ncbi:hypothetical protein ACFW93_05125 [Streptomyces canus]|uniref:hypothetical protein n=1 Tax=Streptomyces canus TaxID=58343 RepID=UPI0036C1BB79
MREAPTGRDGGGRSARAVVGGMGTACARPGARTLRAFDGHGSSVLVSGPGDPVTGGA